MDFEKQSTSQGETPEQIKARLAQGGKEITKNDQEEMKNVIAPFVKKLIMEGDGLPGIASFGDHGHLEYEDEKFMSHYFHAIPEGIMVAMYRKDKDGGLDDSTRQDILVELTKTEKDILIQKLRSFIDEVDWNEDNNGSMEQLRGLENQIKTLS